ncbi:PIN domain-containing protein [Nannocystis sp. ILAH1]|uniref:PIN domain-containing protein n=1 Tax=Nannocystis sp. ILAH1 TaxID=2996789 RepID=UPI002270B73D|nr:PIN domain-containing protein [Nannocystis sp. ILAH1]MCY0989463.1 PIN domain-containing protein [Nannocystis sp. ILAH1]
MQLVLDSHIIVSHPEVLSLGKENTKFVLPAAAVRELSRSRLWRKISTLLDEAQSTGRLQLPPDPSAPMLIGGTNLDIADGLILQTALDVLQAHPNEDVYLASNDKPLTEAARNQGLKTTDSSRLHTLLISEKTLAQPAPHSQKEFEGISQAAASVKQYNLRYVVGAFILGILVTSTIVAIWYFRDFVARTFPLWGLALGTAVLGGLLFWFRSRYRLAYGIAEVLFGLLATTQLTDSLGYNPAFFLQLAAGVYIVVRGLDNVGKGLQGTRMESTWVAWFGER